MKSSYQQLNLKETRKRLSKMGRMMGVRYPKKHGGSSYFYLIYCYSKRTCQILCHNFHYCLQHTILQCFLLLLYLEHHNRKELKREKLRAFGTTQQDYSFSILLKRNMIMSLTHNMLQCLNLVSYKMVSRNVFWNALRMMQKLQKSTKK